MPDNIIIKAIATGKDPLGRWPKNTLVELPADQFEEAMAKGWVDPLPDPEDPTVTPEPASFVQQYDERGRVRMDRTLSADEAAAIDAANRAQYVKTRVERFTVDKPAPGTPYEG